MLRVKEVVPADKLPTTHWADDGMKRRLKVYREQNPEGNDLAAFFRKAIG